MQVSSFQFSETGGRPLNEDCVRSAEQNGRFCFILCDGLGGHARGELASQCVCETVGDVFLAGGQTAFPALMERAILRAQEALTLRQSATTGASHGLRTTLCCLMLGGGDALAAYVGDSRLYQFRAGRVAGRTRDHSVPQHLVNIGEIAESEIRTHEDRNRLLRVMGSEWEEPQFQLWNGLKAPEPGDAFLLCSDGFWEWVLETDMERLLASAADPREWALQMKAEAQKNAVGREMDNFSAITVFLR